MATIYRRLRAFLIGVREFRLSFTTHLPTWWERRDYDAGRAFAHAATFHKFDD